jgi:signal transduction histidine kinase
MLRVLGCITGQHDLRLVLLAAMVCMFACGTALAMIMRARGFADRQRAFWLLAAGTVAGCGIWGTHFVAMLAFRSGLPVSYDSGLTVLSVIVAVALCFAGFALALRPHSAALGGALTGAAIGAMHYAGMAAVRVAADAAWDLDYVIASVLIAVAFSAAGMHVAFKSRSLWGYVLGTVLFTLAVCGMHFTGMSAVTYAPNPLIVIPTAVLDPIALAMAVAAGAILIVALGLIGVIVDNHLARRVGEEGARLRAHIQELQATKAQLEETSARLSAALVTADAANKTKSEFLSAMSHELRTPLNAVIGFSEVMQNEVFGPLGHARYREYVDSIQASGTHLLGLINDVLDMSHLGEGELSLSREDVKIGDLIADAVRAITLQAEAANISLIEDVEPWLPALRVDRRRMRQVLVNLLTNAVKFTPAEGTVRISAYRYGDNLAIQVSDTGIGMDARQIPKALERFGQVDSRLSRKYEGAGLGLPLARQLTELHGGRLELKSAPGAGTTVSVILPASANVPARQAA